MRKRVLFVGYRGKKSHLSEKYECFLLTNKQEYKPEYSSLFAQVFLVNDIFDWEEVRFALEKVSLDGVLTRFEDYIVPVAAIAAEKGLPGIPLEKAENFRNKFLMKKLLADQQVSTADFCLISSPADAEEFLQTHQFPLILKQLSGVHSRFVAKVKSPEDLAQTLSRFQQEITQEAATLHNHLYNHPQTTEVPDPQKYFLLEELLTGEELSIDAITQNGKHHLTPICRYLTASEVGINDHHLPIRILPDNYTPQQELIIYETVIQALDALGADFCGSHTEVFFNRETNQCHVVEVAARSGGFRGEMFSRSTQETFNLNEVCIQAALGESLSLPSSYPVYTAVVEVFSEKKGLLQSINLSLLHERKDLKFLTINRRVGDEVGPASSGGKYIVKFLLEGTSLEEVLSKSTELLHELRNSITLQP